MGGNPSCPDPATLDRLRLGLVPEPHASALRRHQTQCPSCARATRGAGDGVPVGRGSDSGSGIWGASAVRAARSAPPAASPVPTGSRPPAAAPVADGPADVLRPPEGSNELGRLGGYRVLGLLDEDQSQLLYEAVDDATGERIALRVLRPEWAVNERARDCFLEGVKAAATRESTHRAVIHQIGDDNGAVFAALRWPEAPPVGEAAPPSAAPAVADTPRPDGVGAAVSAGLFAVHKTTWPCPQCGNNLRASGGTTWCTYCGYTSASKWKDPETRERRPRIGVAWAVFLVLGCAGILAATVCRDRLPIPGSSVLTWWIAIEGGAGVVLYLTGHLGLLALTIRQWKEGELFKYIDPLTAWRYALSFLPRTGWTICLGGWGATAFLCAFVLFWVNDFALKDKTKKAKHAPPPPVSVKSSRQRVQEEPDTAEYPAARPPAAPGGSGDPGVNVVDLTPAPERQLPIKSTQCVVIGYVADPNDPDKIDRLVLGTRGEDGSIRYAGTVQNFSRDDDLDRSLRQVRALKPLTSAPDYLPGNLNAIPIEPKLVARVAYEERDADGRLKNPVVRGVSAPPPDDPDK